MTDTRHSGTARHEAAAVLTDVLRADRWATGLELIGALLEHPDLLQRLHDERLMNDTRPAPRSIP